MSPSGSSTPSQYAGSLTSASFGKRVLFDKVVPPWERPIAFPPNDISKGLQQTILMLQVAPDQSRNEAKVHLARYVRVVEGNPITAEMTLKQILDARSGFIPARRELIYLKIDQKAYEDIVAMSVALLSSLLDQDREVEAADFAQALKAAGCENLLSKISEGHTHSPGGTETLSPAKVSYMFTSGIPRPQICMVFSLERMDRD